MSTAVRTGFGGHPGIDGMRRLGRRGQRGVVMYVAIIVLLVMTLAGLALLRQIGASSAIAGNIAFKQGATSGADLGIESAHDWLTRQTNTTSLESNQTAKAPDGTSNGAYFANWQTNNPDPTSTAWSAFWAAAPANDDPVTHDKVKFVIHRLCTNTGPVDAGNVCVATNGVAPGRGGDNAGDAPPPPQPYYRVTAQVVGARNTVSYTQVLLGSP